MTSIADSENRLSPLKRAYLALERMQSRLESLERRQREPIAILGMGCRYPGGVRNPDDYWRLLADGRDAITEVPASRWDVDEYYDPDPDAPCKIASRYGGFLEDVDQFDAAFFGVSPREAQSLDPQQRLLLETTQEAFEDAGIATDSLINSQTGVFMGLANGDYYCLVANRARSKIDAYLGTGTSPNAAAGRLSYVFGLRGPCLALDTACSSSLVAIHLACQSLRNGECNLAIAGGVNVMLAPELSITFSKARMLCADGRCKTFDAAANGYVRGEGVGVIVLKRLSDALADSDRILAVVRGSAINQDGPSGGLTVPNGPSQQDVIRRALAFGGVSAEEISYLEAHGTGTALGDPIEMGAIGAVFGQRVEPLWVGSLKTNVGHLEGAAGVAGVMKVILALQHEQIPPHLHFHNPSPRIPWNELPVRIPTELSSWPRGSRRRAAGVSSFGFSGINAHVVLEEAPEAAAADPARRPCQLLTLSARRLDALGELAGRYAAHLEGDRSLQLSDVCYTAAVGRTHREHRAAVAASSVPEACERLRALACQQRAEGLYVGSAEATSPKAVFLFSGQGAQYAGMSRQLEETEPVFRAALDTCEALLRDSLGIPLRDVLYGEARSDVLSHEPACAQAAVFALEYALTQLWQSWGVLPAAVLGDGVGEYVAACAAKVFSVEDALKLLAARGRLARELPCGRSEVVGLAEQRPENDELAEGLGQDLAGQFCSVAETISYARPQVKLISAMTGGPVDEEIARPDYWRRQWQAPSRFLQGVVQLLAEGARTLLELGPPSELLKQARADCESARQEHSVRWLSSLQGNGADWLTLLGSLAELYVSGQSINWKNFTRRLAGKKVSLPTYPFQRRRHWIEPSDADVVGFPAAAAASVHPLLGRRLYSACAGDWVQFECLLSAHRPGFLREHRIADTVVLPAAAYVEIALAAARHGMPHPEPIAERETDRIVGPAVGARSGRQTVVLEDLVLHQAMQFPEGESRVVQSALKRDGAAYRLELYSRLAMEDPKEIAPRWTLHATGRLSADERPATLAADLESLKARCGRPTPLEDFQRQMAACGLDYGPAFRGLQGLWLGEREVLGEVQLPDQAVREADKYLLYPPLLDACLQATAMLVDARLQTTETEPALFVPVGIERLLLAASPTPRLWTHARVRQAKSQRYEASERQTMDVDLIDPQGVVVVRLEGLKTRRVAASAWAAQRLTAVALPRREAGPPPELDADGLRRLPPSQQRGRIEDFLEAELVGILKLPRREPVGRDANLFELGMDSLMAVEFLYRVNMALKTSLSMERLSANAAIQRLAEELAAELNPQDVGGRSVESAFRPQPAAATTLQKSAWFPDHRSAPDARVRLFCFHPPGADAAVFSDWREPLWPDAEVWAMQLPGSGTREEEPHLAPWRSLVETVADEILTHLDRPFAFFGYGSAGRLALDVARWVRERFGLAPVYLFVAPWAPEGVQVGAASGASSSTPPGTGAAVAPATDAEDAQPGRAAPAGEDQERGAGGFDSGPPLDCPVTAFAAENDDHCDRPSLACWSAVAGGGFRLERMPGDPAALLESPEALLKIVAEDLARVVDR